MKQVLFVYDRVGKKGSSEHFWHFMLGYLLPAIQHYHQHYCHQEKEVQFVFEDCGPVMNPVTEELAQLFALDYIIDPQLQQTPQLPENAVVLPRWDKVLQRTSFFLFSPYRLHTDFPFKSTNKYKSIREGMFRNLWSNYRFRRSFLQMRGLLINKVGVEKAGRTSEYLLLKRSEMPSFYTAAGGAKKKGYGVYRRSFQNLDAGQKTLLQEGVAAKIFEPGKHNLSTQIKTFNAAKGVVAIRGADLANIIWLRPGTRVFMINTKGNPPFHFYNLAAILGLKLVERCTDSQFPAFQDLQIPKLIETYG